ncbi:MAG: prolyl oligopeptidase family serine peptidase [Anaerobacillus sp.]|uniref:prolyl oligopeptidase family serine peptidase n=1 Tax=Anaerobacillus sp. TaxID=1872506 RepID=UPI003918B033
MAIKGNPLKLATCFLFLIWLITACSFGGVAIEEESESTIARVLTSENVTLITKVLPLGEVVYAIAADFSTEVDTSNVSSSSFEVEVIVGEDIETRTITNVYTNDIKEASDSSNPGRFVIIELDPSDPNAGTLTFEEITFLHKRDQLKYSLIQKEDIKTIDGTVFLASIEKIQHSTEVTPIVDEFGEFTYQDDAGNELSYRLFEPTVKSDETYPLILFLHGSGERGSDNALQLLGNESALVWARPEQQAKHPAYVLAPQAPPTEVLTFYWTEEPNYSLVIELLAKTIENYPIDTDRIYVTGISNGGVGTWHFIINNPDLFAAAVPICGIPIVTKYTISESYTPLEEASFFEGIKDMPIWVFHAADDYLVDVNYSRDAVATIKSLGGKSINYTEYREGEVKPVGHFAWIPAYQNQEMIDWLFQNQKK